MRTIIFILLLLALVGCNKPMYSEGTIIRTKIYVGKYKYSYTYDEKCCMVMTSLGLFRVQGCPEVPDTAFCYIRREIPPPRQFQRNIAWRLEKQYFSWTGGTEEYRIRRNKQFSNL